MKKSRKRSKKTQTVYSGDNLLVYFFEISPFILGLASIYSSLFAGIIMAVCLLILTAVRKEFHFFFNLTTLAGSMVLLGSIISVFFGLDYGTGLEGLALILSAAVFGLILMQIKTETRREVLHTMPETGIVLLVLSLILCAFPKTKEFVISSGRLNGLFQYANVCALYLLLCLAVLFRQNEELSHKESSCVRKIFRLFIMPAALMGGILWTGSRYTFLLTLALVIWSLIKNKSTGKSLGILVGMVVALVAIYVLITGNVSSFGRFTTISGKASTFIGRVLYWADAIPVIARHPFGLGYLGYHQMESVLQHGYYGVKFVHNEYIQAFLDYGWIGGIGFLIMIISGIKKTRGQQRLLLILISLHMIMDWDMQFFPMLWILLVQFDWEDGKSFVWKWSGCGKKLIMTGATICYIVFSAWLGIGDALDYAGHPDVAWKIYPLDYKYAMKQVYAAQDYDSAEKFAKPVLKLDPCNASVYVLYMNDAFSKGNYQDMIRYGKKAAELARYDDKVLSAYVEKLGKVIEYYEKSGETEKREKAVSAVSYIKRLITDTKETTNPLAWKIKDKPRFTLSNEAESVFKKCQ